MPAIKEANENKKTEKSSKEIELLIINEPSFDVMVTFLKTSPQSQKNRREYFAYAI
jgi:hypothetical protein